MVTHEALLNFDPEILEGTLLQIDEFDNFLRMEGSIEKMIQAKYVLGASASLGGMVGMSRIKDCIIH